MRMLKSSWMAEIQVPAKRFPANLMNVPFAAVKYMPIIRFAFDNALGANTLSTCSASVPCGTI